MKELHVHQRFNPRYQGPTPGEPKYEYIVHKVINDIGFEIKELVPLPVLNELCEKDNWKIVIT